MLTDIHIRYLNQAIKKNLGKPQTGSMAYLGCLPAEVVDALCQSSLSPVDGWKFLAVRGGEVQKQGPAYITADEAVDLRENKQGSILLLLDRAGDHTGMDGIFSAVREISEEALFKEASKRVADALEASLKDFIRQAQSRAKKLGKRNSISPWRLFDFLCHCVAEKGKIGEHLSLLGLWPIDPAKGFDAEDIELSAQLVERLFLSGNSNTTLQARIDALLLPEEAKEQKADLEWFIREQEGRPWNFAIRSLVNWPELWLNRICPGFLRQELRAIHVEPWRSKSEKSKPLKWSGLILPENEVLPVFYIPEEGSSKAKLELRWKTDPEELNADSVSYEVSILTQGEQVLVSSLVSHNGKKTQKCAFHGEDFEELDTHGKWEAKIRIHPVGLTPESIEESENDHPLCRETEDFLLQFGQADTDARVGAGKKLRCLTDEAIKLAREEFSEAVRVNLTEDRKGFLVFRVGSRSGRVYRPSLLKSIENSWAENGFAQGRWQVRIREDGKGSGPVSFLPLQIGDNQTKSWKDLQDATRALASRTRDRGGFIGMIYRENTYASDYINAWAAVLSEAPPELALACTAEIQDLSGQTIGLIVLPFHPLRVAWHQAYDELAYYGRYEESIKAPILVRDLQALDGSYFPAMLPGLLPGKSFVFGDNLGFFCTAMIDAGDSEPQATIARMAKCLSSEEEEIAPSVGITTSTAISRELQHYSDLHPEYGILRINALRAGDGRTVVKALGQNQRLEDESDGEESQTAGTIGALCYHLSLYPGHAASVAHTVGKYISEVTERRRSGVAAVPPDDRWMLTSTSFSGIEVPRLKWAKRRSFETSPVVDPAHVSVAFDTFDSYIALQSRPLDSRARPIEAFGLFPSLVRRFQFLPLPRWEMTIAQTVEGEKHPAGRGLSERLHRIQSAILRATAKNLRGEVDDWPVSCTEVNSERAFKIQRMHETSDWVITVDRNAGLEYFDAPRENPEIYDTYVIDCVPERQDLDCVQLVTSTSQIQDVMRLLDRALADMGLSCSPRNCSFLLAQLKAISGRLAMRLAYRDQNQSELIALAMFWHNCVRVPDGPQWLSPKTGFFMPLDDVRDLLSQYQEDPSHTENDEGSSRVRADLVYVHLSKRGNLQFTFVEIKFRRLLRSTHETGMLDHLRQQLERTRHTWFSDYFDARLKKTQLSIRRKRLARALRFYADKALRHELDAACHQRFCDQIDQLFRADFSVAGDLVQDRGYVFCPEHTGPTMDVENDGRIRIILFGPQGLPDAVSVQEEPEAINNTPEQDLSSVPEIPGGEKKTEDTLQDDLVENNAPESTAAEIRKTEEPPSDSSVVGVDKSLRLLLGHLDNSATPIEWDLSIRGNPHLMLVGQPGMGKTTCIIHLCRQLAEQGVLPIVFSYHEDIEEKLRGVFPAIRFVDIDNGLGFNPLRSVGTSSHAWIDNIGMLRDIFSSIYPDLGEIQTNLIREAIKRSYCEIGYGESMSAGQEPAVPRFQRFFDLLKSAEKPNQGVLARLAELDDYGFFRQTAEQPSLLNTADPVMIRINATQNEVIQNAMASFVLLSLYQNMFLRGAQERITHAVIFDEAHRASRLKLLPTMAKECRKYGLSLIVSSQAAKDFHPSLYSAIANYLILRVTEADAKVLSKNTAKSEDAQRIAGRLKQLEKYTAMFFCEGRRPAYLRLKD